MFYKKVILKDTRREIVKTLSRYLSLLLIVALGTGFFSGLKATAPDMKNTAYDYFIQTNLMDLKMVSTIGIAPEDVSNINSIDGVVGIMPSYSVDLFLDAGDDNLVVKAISFNQNVRQDSKNNINRPVVVEGRLPNKSGECVVEVKIGTPDFFEVGNIISLSSPDSEADLGSYLKRDSYEIVGIVRSPLYIGLERGPTSVGNGEVSSFIILPEEDFALAYYTELYIILDGASEIDPFSEEYQSRLAERSSKIQAALNSSINSRFDKLMAAANNKVDQSRRALELAEHIAYADKATLENDVIADKASLDKLEKSYERAVAEGSATRHIIRASIIQLEQKIQLIQEHIADLQAGTAPSAEEIDAEIQSYKKQIYDAEEMIAQIKEPVLYSFDRYSNADYSSFDSDIEKIDALSNVFPMFFILVAALVCLTTMTRMIEEQRTQIGTYKALGYSRIAIAAKYLIYALSATLIGSIFGLLLGYKILPLVLFESYRLLYNIPEIQTPFMAGYAVAIIFTALAATGLVVISACINELKSEPAIIMRPKAPRAGKRVFLERIGFLWSRLGFLSKVTMRNLMRYKKRFFMTVIGIAGCTALMITGFGIDYSISSIVEKQLESVFLFDGIAAISSGSDIFEAEAIFNREEISSRKICYQTSIDFVTEKGTRNVNMIIPHDTENFSSYINLRDRKTSQQILLGNEGIVISEKLSIILGVKVGDTVTIQSLENKPRQVRVDAINENYTLHYIYMSPALYKTIYGIEPDYNSIAFLTDEISEQAEAVLAFELLKNNELLGLKFTSASDKSFRNVINSLNSIVLVLIICAGALAFIVLYSLSNVNISERKKELATIKLLGFFDGEVSAYIYRENIASAIVGIIFGIPIGILLHKFTILTVEVDIAMFNRSLSWQSVAYSTALTFLFTAIVNVVLHFKLKKIDMVESLKAVE